MIKWIRTSKLSIKKSLSLGSQELRIANCVNVDDRIVNPLLKRSKTEGERVRDGEREAAATAQAVGYVGGGVQVGGRLGSPRGHTLPGVCE
jgi:hypothetical protein